MGGFAAALGGAGGAAMQYGAQMRQLLESRRQDFANLMQQTAQTESDPDTRSALLQHAADAASGKPMGKVVQDFSGTLQKRIKDEQALHKGLQGVTSTIGQQATPPPPSPGATPVGSVAGSGGNALPNAAQPATSPVAQPANGGQIQVPSPVGGISGAPDIEPVADVTKLPPPPEVAAVSPIATTPAAPTTLAPIIKDPQEIVNKYLHDPRWSAPVNRPILQAAMQDELTHNEALRQQADLVENRIRLLADPRIQALPTQLKAQGYSEYQIPSIVGSIIGANVPMIPGIGGAMFNPTQIRNVTAASVRRDYPGVFEKQLAGVADNAPVDLEINKLDPTHPFAVHVISETNRLLGYDDNMNPVYGGSRSLTPAPAIEGVRPVSAYAPVNTGVNGQGHNVYQSRYSLIPQGEMPILGAGINAGFIPTVRETVQDINGQKTIIPLSSKKGGGSNTGAPKGGGVAGTYTMPPPPGTPQTPGRVLGSSQSTFNKQIENPLTAPGQQIMTSGKTVMDQVDKAIKMLEASKNDNTPMKIGLSKALYGLGIADDNSQLINSIELQRLMEAGTLMKNANGSRSMAALNMALTHTPGTLNSPRLMYEKLQNIKQNLQSGMNAAKEEMQRYPGLNRTGTVPPVPITLKVNGSPVNFPTQAAADAAAAELRAAGQTVQ